MDAAQVASRCQLPEDQARHEFLVHGRTSVAAGLRGATSTSAKPLRETREQTRQPNRVRRRVWRFGSVIALAALLPFICPRLGHLRCQTEGRGAALFFTETKELEACPEGSVRCRETRRG